MSPAWLLLAVVGLAAVLRLAGLSALALWGDEYGSINEATAKLGANPASLLYSLILRAFLTFGNGVLLMRLPAVIFGVAAVAALYMLAGTLIDRRTGLVASLLLAASSYAIGYAQQVRFYSLFLLAATLALYSTALLARDGPTTRRIGWFAVANVFCLAAHGLGFLVVGAEIVSLLWLMAPPGGLRRRMLGLTAFIALAGLLLSTRALREWGFHLLARYTAASARYTEPHGLHLTNVVKIAWTFFVFTFGERVYPLWLWLTIPGTLLAVMLVARGLWSQRGNRLALGILLPPLILAPVALYLVFDAITPADLQGASPRYLIPLLGPYLVLAAAGITSWRARSAVTLSLLLALGLSGASLAAFWQNTWNYNGHAPDWSRAAAIVTREAAPGSFVLVDGRTQDPARYYWAGTVARHHATQADLATASLATVGSARRLIVIADTDRVPDQAALNRALDGLQARYSVVDGFVRYPQFVYVLDREPVPGPALLHRTAWQPVPIPLKLYGLGLEDLALPITIRSAAAGAALESRGALTLSPGDGLSARHISLPAAPIHAVLLATTLDGDAAIADGAPVAAVVLSSGRAQYTIVLRKGRDVDDWQRAGSRTPPPGANYVTGYTWTKLASLVGSRAYPEAYQQFTAGIAVAELPLSGQTYTQATLRYLAPRGTLHVWAVAVR